MAAVYYYKVPELFRKPAQVAGEVCEALEQSEAGLTPASLVEASRAESAPLHDEFEWDDEKAGELYRRTQAAGIIRNLRIRLETPESTEETRAFTNIRCTTEPSNYVSITRALDNEDWRGQLLTAAKRDMQSFIAKYRTLEELADVIEAMQEVIAA